MELPNKVHTWSGPSPLLLLVFEVDVQLGLHVGTLATRSGLFCNLLAVCDPVPLLVYLVWAKCKRMYSLL